MGRHPGRRGSAHQSAVASRLERLRGDLAVGRDQPDLLGDEDTHTRIRGGPPVSVGAGVTDEPGLPPAALGTALPGRHASRGRLSLGQAQLGVVAVLVIVGVMATAWWMTGSHGDESFVPVSAGSSPSLLASPGAGAPPDAGGGVSRASLPSGSGVVPGASAGPGAGSPTGTVTVDVAGKVRRPGIAVLDAGSRVVDALHAAGGARAGVDLTDLNLARVLVDGEQIVVGVPAPSGVAASADVGADPVGTLVDINTADQTTLETLPGVGPVTAQAILAWRSEHGSFSSVDQLLDVDGIGEATLAKLTPYVTL